MVSKRSRVAKYWVSVATAWVPHSALAAMPTFMTEAGTMPYFSASTGFVVKGLERTPMAIEPGIAKGCRRDSDFRQGRWTFFNCDLHGFSLVVGAQAEKRESLRFEFNDVFLMMKPSGVNEFFFKGQHFDPETGEASPATLKLWYWHNDASVLRGQVAVRDREIDATLFAQPTTWRL